MKRSGGLFSWHTAGRLHGDRAILSAWCSGILFPFIKITRAEDAFPHFEAMDGHVGVDVETQFHLLAPNLQHDDLEDALKIVGPSDYNRFLDFPR
jgi:hypothetical protein